jgi:hypothetical protein
MTSNTPLTEAERAAALERFKQQRRRATARGIGWQLSFEQWLGLWLASGKWHLRGSGSDKFVMARRGDVGPYSPDNCFICPFEQNVADGHRFRSGKPAGRGWTLREGARFSRRPYQVVYRHKYIGVFATQAEAEAAYLAAVQSHSSSPVGETNPPFFARR